MAKALKMNVADLVGIAPFCTTYHNATRAKTCTKNTLTRKRTFRKRFCTFTYVIGAKGFEPTTSSLLHSGFAPRHIMSFGYKSVQASKLELRRLAVYSRTESAALAL